MALFTFGGKRKRARGLAGGPTRGDRTPSAPDNPGEAMRKRRRRDRAGGYDETAPALYDDTTAVDLIDALYTVAHEFRTQNAAGSRSLITEWEMGAQRFMGNQTTEVSNVVTEGHRVFHGGQNGNTDRGMIRAAVNRTQLAIITSVENQTAEPMVGRLNPAEVGEPATHLLSVEGGKAIKRIIDAARKQVDARIVEESMAAGDDPMGQEIVEENRKAYDAELATLLPVLLDDEQMVNEADVDAGPTKPLTEVQVGQIRELIRAGVLKSDDVYKINDVAITRVMQQVWDFLWAAADGEMIFTVNELWCNIFGNQPMRIQWNTDGPRAHTFSLHNDSLLSVWIDPSSHDISQSGYLGLDHFLTIDRARVEYPDVDEHYLKLAREHISSEGRNHIMPHTQAASFIPGRMVMIRTAWIRHQEGVPMSPAQAAEAGLVSETPKEANGSPTINPETGQQQITYYLAGAALKDGEVENTIEVKPEIKIGHGTRWPDGVGLAQVRTLVGSNHVIERIRCPYTDIPYGWNINILRPDGSPYGQGEPVRLEDISNLINQLLTIIANYTRRYQYPSMVVPQTLYKRMAATGAPPPFLRPGLMQPVPDRTYRDMVRNGGFDKMVMPVPPMSDMVVNLLTILLNEHDTLSSNVAVAQGRAPFSGASGKLTAQLQEAARGPAALRAKFTEWAMQRIMREGVDSAVRWMPESRWMSIVSGYSLSAMREIIRRLEKAKFNTKIEVVTGTGAVRREREQRALALRAEGLISDETTREQLRIENSEDERDKLREQREEQQAPTAA